MDKLKHDELFDGSSPEKDDDKLFVDDEEKVSKKKSSKSVDEIKEFWPQGSRVKEKIEALQPTAGGPAE